MVLLVRTWPVPFYIIAKIIWIIKQPCMQTRLTKKIVQAGFVKCTCLLMLNTHARKGYYFSLDEGKLWEGYHRPQQSYDSNSSDENHMYEDAIKVLLMKQKAIIVNFISKILLFCFTVSKNPTSKLKIDAFSSFF